MEKNGSLQIKPGEKPDVFDTILLKGIMPYIWIGLLGLLVYLQSLFFNFIYFDDNVLILDQQYFIKDITNIFKAFGRDVFGAYNALYYRPLYTISLILNGATGGTNPFVYHLFNCLNHLVVCCLVFKLLLKLKYEKLPAFLVALIFTVLPVLTQAVVWIPGRNDMLLLLFILPAFIFFIEYIEKQKIGYFILHALFFCLAVFTKEIVVALPIILLFYLHFIVREKLFSRNKVLFIITWTVLFSLWFLLRHFALANPIKMTLPAAFKSLVSGLPAIIQYIGKILLPFNLAVLPTIRDTTFIYGIIALVLLTAALVFTRKIRTQFVILWLLWFFLFLLPSFIYPDSEAIIHYREDRLYIPALGILLLLLESGAVNKIIAVRKLAVPVFLSILCLFSVITVAHSTTFRERMVFWKSAVKQAPHSPLAHRNLGAMYKFENQSDNAEAEYRKALELNPGEPMAHNNLGAIYMDRNMLNEAEAEFKAELKINPNFDFALFNLGFVNFKLRKYEEAIRYWKEATRVNDMKLDAYYGLALAYHALQDEATAQYYLGEYQKRGGKVN